MSSLGGNTNGGNSVDPGVPGAGNVDRWSKYQAISNVDVGGYKIINADIDLCNEAIENVALTNCTIVDTLTNSGTIQGGTIDSSTITGGTLNGTTTLAGGHQFSGDLTMSPGNIITTKVSYPSSAYGYIQSQTRGAPDFYMGEDNANPTNDQFGYNLNANIGGGADLGLAINAKNGGAGTDSFETIATLYSSVNTAGFSGRGIDIAGNVVANGSITGTGRSPITNGIAMQGGDFTDLASNDFSTNNATIQTGTFAVKIQSPFGLPLQLEGQNGVIDMTGNSSITNVVMGRTSPTYGYAQSAQKNVKWLGTGSSQIINGLEFVAPNGTSKCFAFIGQRSGSTPSSMGLASKNDHSTTIVGFAPSAISGIEKWSFTAKHQCQYKGKLGKEHYGMVVSATGDVVGLYDKGEVKFGIDHKDPDYSNAVPVVELCSKRASKAVIGVIKEITDTPETTKGDIVVQWNEDGYEIGDKRCQVNSIGEGLIWVANTNGNLEVGDLLQSSSVPGYAEKQDDDIMRASTIGKITMACDFKQIKVPGKKIMTNYKKETLLDTEGRMKWTNSIVKQDKYKMRTLTGGKKACLLSCIYYCG